MMASYRTSWQPCLHGTQFCLFLDENLTGIDNKIWLNLKFCYGNRHFGRGDASRNGGHPITLSNDRMAKEINFSLRSCMKLSQWRPISLSFLPNQNSSPTSWPETPLCFVLETLAHKCAPPHPLLMQIGNRFFSSIDPDFNKSSKKGWGSRGLCHFCHLKSLPLFILNHGYFWLTMYGPSSNSRRIGLIFPKKGGSTNMHLATC